MWHGRSLRDAVAGVDAVDADGSAGPTDEQGASDGFGQWA